MKKLLYLTVALFNFLSPETSFGQCTAITLSSSVNNVTTTSGTISFNCCQTGTYYLEYGPQNFAPGTGSTPGTGGTLISIPSNPGSYILSGLTAETSYDVYLRRNCSGTTWSPNSTKASFTTAPNCAAATAIACNTFYTFNPTLGTGAWSNTCQSISITLGKEKIYSF